MKRWFVLFALLSAAPVANAGDVRTGNDFLAMCGQTKVEFCSAYVTAIHDAALFWSDSFDRPPPFCLPTKSTDNEVVEVVLRYLGEHPEARHKPVISSILPALVEAFRCATPEGTP
jgi:hypothetical protein